MSDTKIRITDNSDLVGKVFDEAIHNALVRIGLQAESFAKKEISRPKPHADGTNRPNVDTGTLRNSINFRELDNEKSVVIGTNVEYAPYVELGTSRSAAYPFLKPAATEHTDVYRRIVESELKNG